MKISFSLSKLKVEVNPVEANTSDKEVKLTKRVWAILIAIITVISIAAWAFYYHQDLTLAYNDARSHLNVARRVVDSLQPGAAQIGSVWLPLYHVLELPFIWNDYLWHSGIAGSIVSVAAFILGAIYIVKIALRLKFDFPSSMVSLAVYLFNPNLLFMQATPMTESLLIFLALATVYHLLVWVETYSVQALILTAFFTFLSTLTRYDGWFVMAFVAGVVALVSFRKRGYKFAEGNVILFGTLAGFGVFLWLLWNQLIFKDALYFLHGEFSAKAQQDILFEEGRLLTKGNLIYSTFVYLLAVHANLGAWVSTISIFGAWIISKSKQIGLDLKIALCVLLSPLVFNILSLYSGNSVLYLPDLPPFTWFNDRYGLMMLPAAAVFVGALVNRRRIATIMMLIMLVFQSVAMYSGNNIITIQDGVRGASGEYLNTAGTWLNENAKTGLIMAAASSNDSLLFRSGFHLKRFIVEGAQKEWETSIVDPTVYAEWIIMHKGDLTYKNLIDNPNFINNYHLVYHDDFSYIYRRNDTERGPIPVTDLP